MDNSRLPVNATYTLNSAYVQGTIKVERNAILKASNVYVISNIQAENAKAVNISGNSAAGSVQIKQGGSAMIARLRITGDLQFYANTRSLTASRNIIGGSLQVFRNTGGLTISNNRNDGNRQCKENKPSSTGGGNIVQGVQEDQGARL